MIKATYSTFKNLIIRVLCASGIAGICSVMFAPIFFFLLLIGIFGLVELIGGILSFTDKLLDIPNEGSILSITMFWSMVVFLVIFAYRISIKRVLENDRATLTAFSVMGVVAIIGFIYCTAHLVQERSVEKRARETNKLVLDFVLRNESVVRQVGENAEVWQPGGSYDRAGSGRYDVSVRGEKTIYAIVDASKDMPMPKLTLLCTLDEIEKRDFRDRRHICEK